VSVRLAFRYSCCMPVFVERVWAKMRGVVNAIRNLKRRRRIQTVIRRFGTLNGFMTQEELQRLREKG
jgi:hypothetical protein